jgi:hypothetical protein
MILHSSEAQIKSYKIQAIASVAKARETYKISPKIPTNLLEIYEVDELDVEYGKFLHIIPFIHNLLSIILII